jgi:tRNA pseudouridine32 synthase / 23S rRNA pseudouridine746 synthase
LRCAVIHIGSRDTGFVMPLKELTADDMLARVLYRDGLMLIVDKPAGLPVHRGPKGGVSLEDYFDVLRFGLPRPPGLAHRLDKDTSGCLVLGRHRKALAHLGLLFKHGKVGKTYWAVVEGGPEADEGTVELSLGRLNEARGWWMKPDPNGLPSVTTWKVLGRATRISGSLRRDGAASCSPPPCGASPADGKGKMTWLALTPITGRTHQLRVHCAAGGWPIVGDNIYGSAKRFSSPPQLLHAREVVVPISKNKAPARVTAPVPAHMRDWLRACGWNGEDEVMRD